MEIPLWVPLVVALIGVVGTVVGTIGGVLITQRAADRREKASRAHGLEREQARWTREDVARTFEHRREAYATFYEALRDAMARINYLIAWGPGGPDTRLEGGWDYHLRERLQNLEIYGSAEVVALAWRAFEVTQAWGDRSGPGSTDEVLDIESAKAREALIVGIRQDLGVPKGELKRSSSVPNDTLRDKN